MKKNTYFPYSCEQCGACCRHINLIPEMSSYNRGDNICKYLQDDNKCKIYKNRPNICNSQYLYNTFFSDMSVIDFHNLLKLLCHKVKEIDDEKLYKN